MPHPGVCFFFVLLFFVVLCSVAQATTSAIYTGQYFVTVQLPMQNDRSDITAYTDPQQATTTSPSPVYPVNQITGAAGGVGSTVGYARTGSGSLQDSDAAGARTDAINDANTDDTYSRLQLLIDIPVIRIDPVGDRHVGDKFNITATTNLAAGDQVLFDVYSPSFQPTNKSQSVQFSGATGTVVVTQGSNGLNELSFPVDASTFKPDKYLVTATAILQKATGTAGFNVLEAGAANTTIPSVTAASTTVAPVMNETTIVPITTGTPSMTPTQTGFYALAALVGLGAVAFFVVHMH